MKELTCDEVPGFGSGIKWCFKFEGELLLMINCWSTFLIFKRVINICLQSIKVNQCQILLSSRWGVLLFTNEADEKFAEERLVVDHGMWMMGCYCGSWVSKDWAVDCHHFSSGDSIDLLLVQSTHRLVWNSHNQSPIPLPS